MRKMRRPVLLSLSLMLALSAAAQPVTATLEVEPESRLPGFYRFWRIVLKNPGPAAAVVPNRMAVQVLPAVGSPSVVIRSFDVPPSLFDGGPLMAPLTLQPGESHDLTHSSLLDELLYAATQSLPPGRYRVQLMIDEALDPEEVPATGRIADLPKVVDPIVSNVVLYEVEQPTGADLKVWELLRPLPPTHWQSLAERIWQEYPDSQYAAEYVPYASRRNHAKAIALYEEALRKKPHPDVANTHRLTIAQHELDRAGALLESSPNPDEAVAACSRAGSHLEHVIRHARLPDQLKAAKTMVGTVQDRESVVRTQNAIRGIFESRLVAFPNCADELPDGSYKVTFGYFVEGDKTFSYAIGAENKFTPPPFDRGQGATFAIGNYPEAFSVITSEPALTWHIGTQNVVAKPRELRACPPPTPEPEPEEQ
jgi:tetratricopeptide (TPR) repeat protein